LKDFDERFHPEDGGKVRYTGQADIGFRNLYTGVHPYFFIASLMDPRTKGMLRKMMTDNQYVQLKSDVLEFMFEAKKEIVAAKRAANDSAVTAKNATEVASRTSVTIAGVDDDDDMFGGLEDNEILEPELPPDKGREF
jgi:hypothetical protein